MQGRELEAVLARLAESMQVRQWRLVTAESCTGGWIGKLCTDRAGSSAWFEAGITVYSHQAKQALLGVGDATLQRYGAVSQEVVLEMASGALERVVRADVTVAVSGIAGPAGAVSGKPVGTVWMAWQRRGMQPAVRCFHLQGSRDEIRRDAAHLALEGLLEYLT